MTFWLLPLRAAVFALAVAGTGSAGAHEGHSHVEDEKTPVSSAATPRLAAASSAFELVAILKNGELAIYVDEVATNAPVTGAQIEVETPAGPMTARPTRDHYVVDAPWARAGSVDLIFTVAALGQTDILSGTLVVPAPSSEPARNSRWAVIGTALAETVKQRVSEMGGLLVVVLAFVSGFLLALLLRRRPRQAAALALAPLFLVPVDAGRAHEGHVHDAPQVAEPVAGDLAQRLADGALFVPKPVQRLLGVRTQIITTGPHRGAVALPGRIVPDPNASGFVQASVNGRLSAPEGGFPRLGTAVRAGDVLAYVTPPLQAIDASDIRQKAGELDQQMSIIERRIARFEQLVRTGAVTGVALDEARLELSGLKDRRAALERVRLEPERLVAPVNGVIAAVNAVAGQIAETNAIVFQIIDPSRLWIEALAFNGAPTAPNATARTGDGHAVSLTFRGAGLADRSLAVPVHYAISEPPTGLRVGQLVTVLAPTGEAMTALAVPRTAIVRNANGQSIVFAHTAPERFEARVVVVEPLDAERALVRRGLGESARVVVGGAELLNQIR